MFARGISAPAQSDLHAFIELAKDPNGFAAKLSELQAAKDAADAAAANAVEKTNTLTETAAVVNTRAAAVEKQAAKVASDANDLEKAKVAHESAKQVFSAQAAAKNLALDTREADLIARTSALETAERSSAALARQAQADRDSAAAHLTKINGIITGLDSLKAQLASLG